MSNSQSQIWTRRRFGYGTYVITAMGDPQGMNHAWYLQNKQPALSTFDSIWRWTEFDWEFVPQCNSATPVNRIAGQGDSLPFSSISTFNLAMETFRGAPGPLQESAGQRTDQSYAQAIVEKQWAWLVDHGPENIPWDSIPAGLTDFWDFVSSHLFLRPQNVQTDLPDGWKSMATFDHSTIGWGNASFPASSDCLLSVPTYIVGSSANDTAMLWPSGAPLPSAMSINVIHSAAGSTPLITFDPAASAYSIANPEALFIPVKLNSTNDSSGKPQALWQFFYAEEPSASQPKRIAPGQGYPGRQSFVYAADGTSVYDPANQFYDYTIVFTPTRVAFFISPPGQGVAENQAPVYLLDAAENPTIKDYGPGAFGAQNTFWSQDYDNPVALGNLFISFQLWNMGEVSFSGRQEADSSMFVRAVKFEPLSATDGAALSLDFTSFTSASQAAQAMSREFAVLNGGAYQAANVVWVPEGPGNMPVLQMKAAVIAGAASEWYGLGPANWTSAPDLNRQLVAKIDDPEPAGSVTYAASSSSEDADWFQVTGSSESSPVTAFLYIKNPATGAEAKAQITFQSDLGLSKPTYTIGTPVPIGSTTSAQAAALFAGLNTAGQVLSPQLYNAPAASAAVGGKQLAGGSRRPQDSANGPGVSPTRLRR